VKRCWGQQVSLSIQPSSVKEWWFRLLSFPQFSIDQCLPDNAAPGERLVTALQLVGSGVNTQLVNEPTDTPLAGNATLTVGPSEQPSVHFTLALGEGFAWIDGQRIQFPMMGATISEFDSESGPGDKPWISANFGDPRVHNIPLQKLFRPPQPEAGELPDGTYRGRLVLEPSRDVALQTKRLDRYLGAALVYDIPVEVSTQRPEWHAPFGPPIEQRK
jgi:hypothetical protein